MGGISRYHTSGFIGATLLCWHVTLCVAHSMILSILIQSVRIGMAIIIVHINIMVAISTRSPDLKCVYKYNNNVLVNQ